MNLLFQLPKNEKLPNTVYNSHTYVEHSIWIIQYQQKMDSYTVPCLICANTEAFVALCLTICLVSGYISIIQNIDTQTL